MKVLARLIYTSFLAEDETWRVVPPFTVMLTTRVPRGTF